MQIDTQNKKVSMIPRQFDSASIYVNVKNEVDR